MWYIKTKVVILHNKQQNNVPMGPAVWLRDRTADPFGTLFWLGLYINLSSEYK